MDNDQIAGSAREATETLRHGSRDVAKKVGEYTLGALLVAGGVGFALAVLMADRRQPQRRDYWDRGRDYWDRGRDRDRDR